MIRQLNCSGQKCVLVDIDTQRCFFQNTKPCDLKDIGVLANIRRVMAWARLKNIFVVSTKKVPVCYRDSQDTNINEVNKIRWTLRNKRIYLDAIDYSYIPFDILDVCDQVVLCKRSIDPFEEPRVDRILTELQASEFILIGSFAEGAIQATALGLLARRKKVKVLTDAINTENKKSAKVAQQYMLALGAKLITTRQFIESSLRHEKEHLCRSCSCCYM